MDNQIPQDWNDFFQQFPELDLDTMMDSSLPPANEGQPGPHVAESNDWTRDIDTLGNTTDTQEQPLGWIDESFATVLSPPDQNTTLPDATLPELISDMQLLQQT